MLNWSRQSKLCCVFDVSYVNERIVFEQFRLITLFQTVICHGVIEGEVEAIATLEKSSKRWRIHSNSAWEHKIVHVCFS